MMDKEMIRALQADGEKLRHLTGEEHGPKFRCDDCDGLVSDDGFSIDPEKCCFWCQP